MTHRYDWSKLDAGWMIEELGADIRVLAFTKDGLRLRYAIESLEASAQFTPTPDARWNAHRSNAFAQLAKCRVRDTEPVPPECDHDHSTEDNARATVEQLAFRVSCGLLPNVAANALFADRSPVDNTPLFEAMDKMMEEAGTEDVRGMPYPNGLRCKSCGADRPHECPGPGGWVMPRHDPTLFEPEPFQPWRRGPLASWTLVNISCHDGRLTVVMKRGRGELVDETGPDDETLWERLAAKVVEFEAKRTTK